MKINKQQIQEKLALFYKDVEEYGSYNIEDEVTRAIIFESALELLGHNPADILANLEVK